MQASRFMSRCWARVSADDVSARTSGIRWDVGWWTARIAISRSTVAISGRGVRFVMLRKSRPADPGHSFEHRHAVLFNKVMMDFDSAQKRVRLEEGATRLRLSEVVAVGGQTGYFGHRWEQFAPSGLKTLDETRCVSQSNPARVRTGFGEQKPIPPERDRLTTVWWLAVPPA